MTHTAFISDIDNTLIYSYKHPHDGFDCVQLLHGNPQAFMSPVTRHFLRQINEPGAFIPVTSRSVAQYTRLAFPEGCVPERAVTSCGGVLLTGGVPDPMWQEETSVLVAPYMQQILRLEKELSDHPGLDRCRVVDDTYLFIRTDGTTDPRQLAGQIAGTTNLHVDIIGKKLYLTPPSISKGTAVQRLKERFGFTGVICAGDSGMDLSMLAQAEHRIIPAGLAPLCNGKGQNHVCPSGWLFSDYAAETAYGLMNRSIL